MDGEPECEGAREGAKSGEIAHASGVNPPLPHPWTKALVLYIPFDGEARD